MNISKIFEEFYKEVGAGNPSCAIKAKQSARVKRALDSYKPVDSAKRRLSKANEIRVARAIKGKQLSDNEPMDVIFYRKGKLNGIEVKTIIEGSDKITMHKDSRLRKLGWSDKRKAGVHTVVVKGKEVYYRKGVGSWKIQNMTKVENGYQGLISELKL